VGVPTYEEQTKIVSFLTTVDKKINLLYKKQDYLKDFKKFCLQNLFIGKLRFKNLQVEDNSDWKKFILKDILLSSSSNLSMADLEDNFGDYKLYGATGFIKCIDFFDQKEGYMAIVKDGAGVGKTFLCDPKSSVLSTLLYLTPKKDYNLKFCYYLLKTLHFGKYKVGSTIPHIYYKDFSKEKVFIPSVEEQEKIARFLTAIDKKIDFTQNQITEMEKFKKGLLQQMFVYLIFYTSIFLILIFFKIILNNKCIILYFIGSFY
jgi:type I restriction enzyme S subunit